MKARVVLDTNVLISRILVSESVPARAARYASESSILLASEETMEELVEVLSREKFDRYLTITARQDFLRWYASIVKMTPILHVIQACLNPKDDKFLSLAVNGEADMIVTGDQDLLCLDPFRNIRILAPAAYLEVS